MRLIFSEEAWEDYLYWQKTDKALLRRINELIRDAQRNAFDGLGKPEPLKHNLQGWWSRRINQEHRMVYKVEGNDLIIAMLRYHYED
ncbi:Txe/YoeB family addiction module toxin [Calidithermus roseus]|uniref:Putative mRNA interferase YoeB n=1 Tax=Calidithermus roseus TaxID=1644118 RepID=A0A399EN71_9DEIN|nr:Txe/YoeB family addiction module toxin [Calidithermus roseus]RIH84499.1 Toxin YoeB [Calidithermus roseus]